ncbi:MAG TPA: BRO family protein [bacterium]|nr:BRO family protein [bacterium]
MKNKIKLFQKQKVRSIWDEKLEEWFFSIVDIVGILTESQSPQIYWRKLKQRLKEEGNETVTNCHALKMVAEDGKMRLTDIANTKDILRLIQSIPSKKAEPFKIWLAEVGNDRINESQDPELAIDRAMISYRNLGYSEEWINTRLQSIQFRKELTDEWKRSGVKEGADFAILTNIITEEWAGKTIKEYKKFKGLKKENLRDNMTSLELALNILAETSTTELSRAFNPDNIDKNKDVAKRGGKIAGDARKNIEAQTKKAVISPKNSKNLRLKK